MTIAEQGELPNRAAPASSIDAGYAEAAANFCISTPHRVVPYSRRNWGGALHSLCSYNGKLKPAIAHFLVRNFTEPGQVVFDPMSGVGTIPLEARRLNRIGIASDLSPLGAVVSRAKLEQFTRESVQDVLADLGRHVVERSRQRRITHNAGAHEFGLNGPVSSYYHQQTLAEICAAREFFQLRDLNSPAVAFVLANLLHILHGNRPYALSRRSHPVTPLVPSGPFEYKNLISLLVARVDRIIADFLALSAQSRPGRSYLSDFRFVEPPRVDAIITSPPFSKSLRFWSMNWLRLWFVGWDKSDFVTEPAKYLETQQKLDLQSVYREFGNKMKEIAQPDAKLIMHVGRNRQGSMADEIVPAISDSFDIVYVGEESVTSSERHGLTDKGGTEAHVYLFAQAKRPTTVHGT